MSNPFLDALAPVLATTQIDPTLLAALLLKVPQSGDANIDAMIRAARTLEISENLSVAQASDPAAQKDLLRTLQRNYIVAQQIQSTLERFAFNDLRAAA
jgi:hypothetical protein